MGQSMQHAHSSRYRVIDIMSQNWLFRWSGWLLKPSNILVFTVVYTVFCVAVVVLIFFKTSADFQKDQPDLYWALGVLIAAALGLFLLPRLSQLYRTIGQNRVSLGAIKRALEHHHVLSSRVSNIRPVGVVIAFTFLGSMGAGYFFLRRRWPEAFGIIELGGPFVLVPQIFVFVCLLRYFQRPAIEVLASGHSPVVLLRSFGDDGIAGDGGSFLSNGGLFSLEQFIGTGVQPFGPFIAIGRPSESVPLLGAARTYLRDDTWQAHALHMMETSRLIIMIAGTTEGLRWELDRIVEGEWYRKLIIIMPQVPNEERTRRMQSLSTSLAGSAWGKSLSGAIATDVIAIRLESDGSSVVVAARGYRLDPQFFREAVRVAIYGILCRQLPQP
jgi:hypothetical protein